MWDPDCPAPLVDVVPCVVPAGVVAELPPFAGGLEDCEPGTLPPGVEAGGPAGVSPGGVEAGGPPGVFPAGVVAGGPGVLPAGVVVGFPPLSVDDVPSVTVLEPVLVPGLGIDAQNACTDSPWACARADNRENATDESAFPLVVLVDERPSGAK